MADTNSIQYAGEFAIAECILYTVGGKELDLTDLVVGVNIYESIFNNSITGDIVPNFSPYHLIRTFVLHETPSILVAYKSNQSESK